MSDSYLTLAERKAPALLFLLLIGVGCIALWNTNGGVQQEPSITLAGQFVQPARVQPASSGHPASPWAGYRPQFRSVATHAVRDRMYGIGSSPLAKLAITAIQANNRMRDVSAKAGEDNQAKEMMKEEIANLDDESKAKVEKVEQAVTFKAQDMSGVSGPMGFFDPFGFTTDTPQGKVLFYREVELKHGRVAMLASLGFLVGEQFHPLFGGDIDVPSYIAFQQTPLQAFWPAVVAAIAIPELFSIFTFKEPDNEGNFWMIKEDHTQGRLITFDPLGLKPKDPKEFKEMQTKELNNGRLAMIAAAGMIAQELATGEKLF